jgi:hypothetical protein
MQKSAELMRLLGEWRRLSEAEGHAIDGGNWGGVADQQAQKLQLQQEIARVIEQPDGATTKVEDTSGGGQPQLGPLVRDLIALEIRNRDVLVTRRQGRQPESQRTARTVRRLQDMRRVYGASADPRWQSYS